MTHINKEKAINSLNQILKFTDHIKKDPINNTNQEILDKISKASTKVEMLIRKGMANVKR